MAHELRLCLKITRDPGKTAYDLLPTGETIGEFANRYAVDRYKRKIESKKFSARENRKNKRREANSFKPYKQRSSSSNSNNNNKKNQNKQQ